MMANVDPTPGPHGLGDAKDATGPLDAEGVGLESKFDGTRRGNG